MDFNMFLDSENANTDLPLLGVIILRKSLRVNKRLRGCSLYNYIGVWHDSALCLLRIALAQKKIAHATATAKNASTTTKQKTNYPTAQGNAEWLNNRTVKR